MTTLHAGMLNIDFVTTPYQRHSATSKAAAKAIAPRAEHGRTILLNWLRARPQGATDEEMQAVLCANTQRPRRVELVKAGQVVASGEKAKTTSGRNAVIWVAV